MKTSGDIELFLQQRIAETAASLREVEAAARHLTYHSDYVAALVPMGELIARKEALEEVAEYLKLRGL